MVLRYAHLFFQICIDIYGHNFLLSMAYQGFPGGATGKEVSCQSRRHKRYRFDPWVGKIPWRRAGQPTLVFLLASFLIRVFIFSRYIMAYFSQWEFLIYHSIFPILIAILLNTWTVISMFLVVVQLLSHVRLFCDPMDPLPVSPVHGISRERMAWVATSFSRGYLYILKQLKLRFSSIYQNFL